MYIYVFCIYVIIRFFKEDQNQNITFTNCLMYSIYLIIYIIN